MIYPTGRAVWLAAAGTAPAFLLAIFLPGLWYIGLGWTCAVIGFTLVDAVAGPGRTSVRATVSAPRRISVGSLMTATIGLETGSAGPHVIEARLGHDPRLVPVSGATPTFVAPARDVAVRFRAVRRGLAGVDRLWLRWRGPFGLVWKQTLLPVDLAIAVMPDIDTARDQAVAFLQRDAQFGDHVQAKAGEGREFDSLREYRPGIDRRLIDWKHTARHGQLLAREFRIEHNNTVAIAIDSGRLMCEPLHGVPKIDRAVTAALLMSYLALHGGDLVTLFSFDARPIVSSGFSRGTGSFPAIQQLAATIDYSTEETNFTLALTTLAGKLSRRSLIVVFTDFVDAVSAELMLRATRRLTERHLVLFMLMRDEELEGLVDEPPATLDDVARAVTAGTLMRERDVVIARLRLLGAHVVEADHRDLGPELVDRYLKLKQANAL